MAAPDKIIEHSHKYIEGTWRNYSFTELTQWVSLLTKRAGHRINSEKADKDLRDAQNYLFMLNEKFGELADQIAEKFNKYE